MTTEQDAVAEYRPKTITFRCDPDPWAAFRSAVLLDGDTCQRLLESFVADYVERARQDE